MNIKKQPLALIVCFYFCNHLLAKTIAPGVNYHHLTNKSQSVHILTIDPEYAHITIGMPGNNCTQKTSAIAAQNNAIAAINGSFFQFKSKNMLEQCFTILLDFFGYDSYNAFASYTLQSNNHLYSTSDNIIAPFSIICRMGTPLKNGFSVILSSYLNGLCYTSLVCWNNKNQQFYSLQDAHNMGPQKFTDLLCATYENILASTPLLVNKNIIPEELFKKNSKFYMQREPRTAIGMLKNGNWVFVVVDGRSVNSKGFTLVELAHFMQKLGCTEALNLCGASRSTMVIHNKVVNSPSGRKYYLFRHEYPVHNALLVCTR